MNFFKSNQVGFSHLRLTSAESVALLKKTKSWKVLRKVDITAKFGLKPGRGIYSKPGKRNSTTFDPLTWKWLRSFIQLPGAEVGVPVKGGKLHDGGLGQNFMVPRVGRDQQDQAITKNHENYFKWGNRIFFIFQIHERRERSIAKKDKILKTFIKMGESHKMDLN